MPLPSIQTAFLAEFDHEMANTRRTLERVPDDRMDWRPHAKSRPLGGLAAHLAQLPGYLTRALRTESLDLAAPRPPMPALATRADLLDAFDRLVAEARTAMAEATEEQWMHPWTFRNGDHVIFTLPRMAVARNMCLNHTIHHRAQLGVYLRLLDVPVPGVYGPSADEG